MIGSIEDWENSIPKTIIQFVGIVYQTLAEWYDF